jgi:hypothetical protein
VKQRVERDLYSVYRAWVTSNQSNVPFAAALAAFA